MAEFMLHIIKVNVLSAFIIFIVLAVSRLLDRKYSSRWKYLIWLFVSVFLLIPVRFPSPAAGLNIEVPKQIVRAEASRSTNTSGAENLQSPADTAKSSSDLQKDTDKNADLQGSTGQENITMDTVAWIMAIIWGAGICTAAVYKVFVLRAGRQYLRRWRIPFTNRERIAEYDKLCKEMHLKKAPKLVANSRLSGPLLAGIRNTFLYLPVREYSKEECEMIFRHELCHYRSRDPWYKLLMICITTVYWFNPAVYFMKKEAERDIEFICDEKVMKGRNREDKLRYNQLLLKTAALGRPSYELSTSLNDGLLTFKKRMVNIMKAGKMKRGILPVICFTIILVTSNVFTGCSLKDSGEKKKDADTEATTDSGVDRDEDTPAGNEEKDKKRRWSRELVRSIPSQIQRKRQIRLSNPNRKKGPLKHRRRIRLPQRRNARN
ncbi:M56 family metallopeptidase [Blautia sp. RD014234]|nr:M56 family metallopeptidase [Blautia parvula]